MKHLNKLLSSIFCLLILSEIAGIFLEARAVFFAQLIILCAGLIATSGLCISQLRKEPADREAGMVPTLLLIAAWLLLDLFNVCSDFV